MKTVVEMAREAGFMGHEDSFYTNHRYGDCKLELEAFAELVRADEREACAKEVENYALGYAEPVWAFKVASIIRDRGNR